MTNPVFVALDTPDLAAAKALARGLKPYVGGLKLGLEFFSAHGPDGVREFSGMGLPVFLDLKFHDIPNTVAGAVRSALALDVAIVNVHAAGGPAMLAAMIRPDGSPPVMSMAWSALALSLPGITVASSKQSSSEDRRMSVSIVNSKYG